jgi:hypothetical protein
MDEAAITRYICDTFEGVETVTATGNTFFFYDPDHMFAFATLMTNDENDQASDLNRPGVYRLNIGVSKATYQSLFGTAPPPSGEVAGDTAYDFTVLDQVIPHPVYGRMHWVAILNPSATTFQTVVQPLLAEAYERDVRKHTRRAAHK